MKTMIKALAFTGLVLAASAAKADYLYWMISEVASKYEFSYAKLKVSGTENYLSVYNPDGGTASYNFWVGENDADTGTSLGATWANFGSYGSGYSYLLELYNDDELVGTRAAVAYTAMTQKGSVFSDPLTATGMTAYDFGGSDVIPEPCTGLLGLLGLGVIGLRKRFKKAKKA